MRTIVMTLWIVVLSLHSTLLLAEDWPEWRGKGRTGVSRETGLLKQWPESGPKKLWSFSGDLGQGYSAVSVAGGTIYATGVKDGQGILYAIDLEGKLKWEKRYGEEWTRNYAGSRTTPTVDGDRVYVVSGLGQVVCLKTADGGEAWSVDTAGRFDGKNIRWGIAESPLVHGDLVISSPGGPDAAVVALNKMTGDTVWTSKGLSDKSAYCSPVSITDKGRDLVVTVTDNHIVGMDAKTGTVYWKHPYRGKYQAHANTPLYHDDQVYVTSGYDCGGVMLKLAPDGKSVTQLWKDDTLDTHHGGVVYHDGHIYGASWNGNGNGNWVCLDWKSGDVRYDTNWRGKGSIIAADGMLICYLEKGGEVALAKATPDGFSPVSFFEIKEGSSHHWAHPSLSDGVLYIRHGGALMAYRVK